MNGIEIRIEKSNAHNLDNATYESDLPIIPVMHIRPPKMCVIQYFLPNRHLLKAIADGIANASTK